MAKVLPTKPWMNQKILKKKLDNFSSISVFVFPCAGRRRRLCGNSSGRTEDSANAAAPTENYANERSSRTIQGVWMFCRHGDRTPSRPLTPPQFRNAEAQFWVTQLPTNATAQAVDAFRRRGFPPAIGPNVHPEGRFLDVKRNPFGFLTQKGLEQLRNKGMSMARRYQNGDKIMKEKKDVAHDFLQDWNVQAYSTNYLRTVLSVQSFLDGLLLGTQESFKDNSPNDAQTPTPRRPHGATKEVSVPDHHTWSSSSKYSDHPVLVPVRIRELQHDPLNAFDRNPALMAQLVSDVVESPDFVRGDAAAAPLAAQLARILPGLVPPREVRLQKQLSPYNRSPSGINWVEAADHFVCRQAHNLPYSKFAVDEHEDDENDNSNNSDDRVEQLLQALSHRTLYHLAWRFRQWYQSPPLLAALAVPPLAEVAAAMEDAASQAKRNRRQQQEQHKSHRRPFSIYSCHDVTLLGLLYALQADFLVSDDDTDAWRHYWPAYASTLVLELVVDNVDNTNSSSSTNEPQSYVRILLNDKLVRCCKRQRTNDAAAEQQDDDDDSGMLTLAEFTRRLRALEVAGGHDYDELLGKK